MKKIIIALIVLAVFIPTTASAEQIAEPIPDDQEVHWGYWYVIEINTNNNPVTAMFGCIVQGGECVKVSNPAIVTEWDEIIGAECIEPGEPVPPLYTEYIRTGSRLLEPSSGNYQIFKWTWTIKQWDGWETYLPIIVTCPGCIWICPPPIWGDN